MLSHLDFQQGGLDFVEDKSGQWLFIHRALQKEFAPRPQGGGLTTGELNDGLISDYPVVDDDEEWALKKMFEPRPAHIGDPQPLAPRPYASSSAFDSLVQLAFPPNSLGHSLGAQSTLPACARPGQPFGHTSSTFPTATYGQLYSIQPGFGQVASAHTYPMLPPTQQPPFAVPTTWQQPGRADTAMPDANAGEDVEMTESGDAEESVSMAQPGQVEHDRQSMARLHMEELLRRRPVREKR